nr:PREDICTED: uncharacterized protein LOC107079679 isoform X2 [Lepisosteus oculatus]
MEAALNPQAGRGFPQSSHIQLGHRLVAGEEGMRSTFQRDFRPFGVLPKSSPIPLPKPAEVEHKDVHRIREYQMETSRSFTYRPREPLSQVPAWSRLSTNFKMHSDQKHVTFCTTQSEGYQRHPPTPVPNTAELATSFRNSHVLSGETLPLPLSNQQLSFTGHKGTTQPPARPPVRHLGGDPTIFEDRDQGQSYTTHYQDVFKGSWSSPPQQIEKKCSSSVAMGDPEKIHETLTTHASSFYQKDTLRYDVRKEIKKKPLKINFGDYPGHNQATTASDSYRPLKSDPVVRPHRNENTSSLPEGDTDAQRNRERMSATSHRLHFSQLRAREPVVHVDGTWERTRSSLEIGKPSMGSLFYSTTSQADYRPQRALRVRPASQPSGSLRPCGYDRGTGMTTMQRDYQPHKSSRFMLNPSHLHQCVCPVMDWHPVQSVSSLLIAGTDSTCPEKPNGTEVVRKWMRGTTRSRHDC